MLNVLSISGNVKFTDRPLLEISNDVISKISKTYPAPYTLMCSGGIDTQSMLWCWYNSDVDFDISVVRYIDDFGNVLNYHDIRYMEEFTKKIGISINYYDFNVISFLEKNLNSYATKYECNSPQICTHMAMSELITEGTVIFSGDFLKTSVYDYTILGLKRYADRSGRSVIPFFFLHDPELAGVLHRTYDDSKCDTTERDVNNRSIAIYGKKVQALRDLGIPLIPQECKLTGFEIIKNIYDTRKDLITQMDRIKYASQRSKRIFDISFRYKLDEIIKASKS